MRTVALAVLFALPLAAQTFVVDASNGPGTHFTDLPTAVQTVPDGAILLVRPGTYGAVTLSGKGLSILGTGPGVVIHPPASGPATVPVFVTGLAAHQAFTLRDVNVVTGGTSNFVLFRDCLGPILVDGDTTISNQDYLGLYSKGIDAQRCAQVVIRNSTLQCFQAVHGLDSQLVCENCQLIGHDAYSVPMMGAYAGTGLVVEGGSASLSRCTVRGGNGTFLPFSYAAPAPAVWAYRCTLRLTEDTTGSYTAGQFAVATAVAAIDGANSRVVRDASPTVTGSQGGAAVGAGLIDEVRPLPSLHTVGAPPGGVVTADVTTPIGQLVLLAVALPGVPTAVPGVDGDLWLDLPTVTLVAAAMPQLGVPVSVSVPVPNLPFFVGTRFAWQALAFDPLRGLVASNPSVYAH